MIYQSVADIFAANDKIRRRVIERAEGLSEAQLNYRLNDGAWTPAEIVEHLAIIEPRLTQVVGMLLKKTEAAAAEAGTPPPPMQPFSLDDLKERAKDKFVAPEELRPRGDVPVADALVRLDASRAALQELRPRLEAVDGTLSQYPHPAFGPLNLYQWLALIGMHEARHLRQLDGLLASAQTGPES